VPSLRVFGERLGANRHKLVGVVAIAWRSKRTGAAWNPNAPECSTSPVLAPPMAAKQGLGGHRLGSQHVPPMSA